MVKPLKGRKVLTNHTEEHVDVDSDCEGEGGSTGADTGTLKEEEHEETRAVLIAGSFSAYARLLAPPSRWLKRRF